MSSSENQQHQEQFRHQADRVRSQIQELQRSLERQSQQRQEQQRQAQQRQEQQRQAQQRQEQQRQAQQRQEQQRQAQQRQEQQRQAQQRQEKPPKHDDDQHKNALVAARLDSASKSSENAQMAVSKEPWDTLEDAAAYALRRDEEHAERQDQLSALIEETEDPHDRQRLELVREAEHHAYSADQIDRIMEMTDRFDRLTGSTSAESPEMQGLRERGQQHRVELGETMKKMTALNIHSSESVTANASESASSSKSVTPNASKEHQTSPHPSFAERASARRAAAEAAGSSLPPRADRPSPDLSHASTTPPTPTNADVRARSR